MSGTRTLYIGIASLEETKKRTIDIASGKRKRGGQEPTIWFTSPDDFGRVFSKKTMLLLEIIRSAQPNSLADLAKRAGQAKSNVSRTLHKLEKYGIVQFEERPGNRIVPRMPFDRYVLEGSWSEHHAA